MMDLLSVSLCSTLKLYVEMKLRTPTQMLSYLLMHEMNPSLRDCLDIISSFAFVLNHYESYIHPLLRGLNVQHSPPLGRRTSESLAQSLSLLGEGTFDCAQS